MSKVFGSKQEPIKPSTIEIAITDINYVFQKMGHAIIALNENVKTSFTPETIGSIEKTIQWANQYSQSDSGSVGNVAMANALHEIKSALSKASEETTTIEIPIKPLEDFLANGRAIADAATQLSTKQSQIDNPYMSFEEPKPITDLDALFNALEQPAEGETYRSMSEKLFSVEKNFFALLNKLKIKPTPPQQPQIWHPTNNTPPPSDFDLFG